MDWVQVKSMIGETTLHKDALHVYVAVALQVGAAAIFRRPLSSVVPWLAVLAAQAANEYLDMFWGETQIVEPWQVAGSVHDMWNTMLLPTALLMLTRFAPRLFRPAARSPITDASDASYS